jgi:multiple sugar transport system ATP-binding protein
MNLISGNEAKKYGAHTIGIRPEHLAISTKSGDWQGVVGVSEHLGSDTFFHVNCANLDQVITVRANGEIDFSYGTNVFLSPDMAYLHKFDADGLRQP